MKKSQRKLFDRVAAILEQARANVVRTVNAQMTIAYWHIGQEIVQALQGGSKRAEYGKQLIHDLSIQLTKKYGRGFSTTNLWYFRQFYLTFVDRAPKILHMPSGECDPAEKLHKPCGVFDGRQGFSSQLSWSHYRTLSKITHNNERQFYEIEAEKEKWSVPELERQIHSFLFARLLKSRKKGSAARLIRTGQVLSAPTDTIKDPYVLDFLGLPDAPKLHETLLEASIIENLQSFLLELGKGFAFVARQKRLLYEDDFFYVDLVFYNCILKCYLLVDLKVGKLTHQDVGQMDSYIRMFDDLFIAENDNPTIGLILCAEKNETVAKYSVLKNSKQLFASKYMLYLPTEEELRAEIERERWLLAPPKKKSDTLNKRKK